jgi:hypothetical protein
MTTKRNIGRAAAIGGLTATIALLTGLPAATADELADLRANQELLQRRIDQLAQAPSQVRPGVPGGYGTEAIPGQAIIGGSFPRSFLIPGTDTSIRVGGFADETFDYYFKGGGNAVNGSPQSTTVGINGQLPTIPLNIKNGATVGGPFGVPAPTLSNFNGNRLAHSRGNGVFSQSPRETRLNVETRTPTAWGESRTFVEFDFAGSTQWTNGSSAVTGNGVAHVSDNLVPRLRYAYGTLGGILAGQANSNFRDSDAEPETLDFGGPAGQAGVNRVPQVRYTLAGPWGSSWSVSAETPETDIITPAGLQNSDASNTALATGAGQAIIPAGFAGAAGSLTNATKASSPDITFTSYWSQPWGHVDFRGVVRPTLSITDGAFLSRTYVGYGGGVSGDVKLFSAPPFDLPGAWQKDDFQWQFSVGNGLGRYINDGSDAALSTNFTTTTLCAAPTPAGICGGTAINAGNRGLAASNILVKPVPALGWNVGYQHWWAPNWRSNVSYGWSYHAYASNILGPTEDFQANKLLQNAHVNVIWSPVAFIDTGLEFTWGKRTTVANFSGEYEVLIGKFRVKF